jgi:uncharacterized SAM-binding protein YcdF (DUF218 family)
MKYIRTDVSVYIAICVLLAGWIVRCASVSLIVDTPIRSDLILVPSGDFALRTERAIALAEGGFARLIVVDEGADTLTFGRTLAERRIEQLSGSGMPFKLCPIEADSTSAETREAARCLRELGPRRVLIVTSDFHTRRSLAMFQRAMPETSFSVAAARTSFSTNRWWSTSSLKITAGEWGAILWWKIAER